MRHHPVREAAPDRSRPGGPGGGCRRDGLAAHAAPQIRDLAEHGHRRIAPALPEEDSARARARRRSAEHTAHSLGLPPLVPVTVERPRRAGTDAVAGLREGHPGVTAVAAFDDGLALRTLTALHDLGLSVPGDNMAVTGYDDTGYGELSTPAPTTGHIDAEAHGRRGAPRWGWTRRPWCRSRRGSWCGSPWERTRPGSGGHGGLPRDLNRLQGSCAANAS
ncbi:substrate-binding domain-containing protein [Streptomyces sp. NPDC059224]|uniref:substrate-binding domain-containing protein n=1 Tax=Streptomyces sp. NPDC059224 TaxID=3346775 RepID=UPI003679EA4C